MLAKANRITRGSDYKSVVRRGYRVSGAHTVTYLKSTPDATPARFGFIVAKNVGGAVVRNRVRRRMKAASFQLVPTLAPGTDIVIRALPAAEDASWSTLFSEISAALSADRVPGRRSRP